MKLLLSLLLIFSTIPAWAKIDLDCETYEDCLEKGTNADSMFKHGGSLSLMNHFKLRAILYELDEISGRLDKSQSIDELAYYE